MSYKKFVTTIGEAPLLEVLAHWHAACCDRQMPGWKDIDAVALGRKLPIIWAWRWDVARDTFIGRLAGEEIVAVLGNNIRGKPIEACFPSDTAAVVRERYKAVMDGPRFMRGHGKVFARLGGTGYGERIVLPLAADGVHSDGVLGATVYRLGAPPVRGEAAIDHLNEVVTFYPLGD
jgi:hypothetical protein